MLVSYGLSCEQLYLTDLPAWRKAVKQAVLHKALFFYEPKQSLAAARLPGFMFEYLGRQYLFHECTSELADLAVHLRADRLPGVPQPYEHHPCPWCRCPRGLNGLHLLQCSAMPSSLAQERQQLRQRVNATTPLGDLAHLLVACRTDEQAAELTRQGLLLFRKVTQAVKKQLWTAATQVQTDQVFDSLVQLFSTEDSAFEELETAVTNDRLSV